MSQRVALIALAAAFVALHAVPRADLWCVRFCPPWGAAVLILTWVALLVPGVQTSVLRAVQRAGEWVARRSRRWRVGASLVISLATFAPFRLLADNRRFGDGVGLIGLVQGGYRFDPHAPLGLYLQSRLFEWARHHDPKITVVETWGTTSALAGVAFVFVTLCLADLIGRGRREKAILAGLILTLASMQLFFSEVEDYATSTLAVLGYLYFAGRACQRGRGVFAAAVLLSLSMTFSMSTAFLVPSLAALVLVVSRGESLRCRFTTAALAAAGVVLPLGFVLLAMQCLGGVDVVAMYTKQSHLSHVGDYVTLYGRPRSTFSLQHWTDLVQLNVLVAPFSVALLVLFARRAWGERVVRDPFVAFSVVLTGCACVFLLFWIPGFTMDFDWDLFSMFALPTTVTAALLATRVRARPLAAPDALRVIALSAVHAGLWVWTGHTPR